MNKQNQTINFLFSEFIQEESTFFFSEQFKNASKGNPNNAIILFTSLIRELLNQLEIKTQTYMVFEKSIFKVNPTPIGDFKIGAKKLLEQVKSSKDKVEDFQLEAIIVAGQRFNHLEDCPLTFLIDQEVASLKVIHGKSIQKGITELVAMAFELFERNVVIGIENKTETKNQFQQSIKQKHKSVEVLKSAWDEVFNSQPDLSKGYFANGGDSIQAIRLISKIKNAGFVGDFGKLLSSKTLFSWKITDAPTSIQLADVKEYPLTLMQQKIWNQIVSSEQQVYHEQFLFKLFKIPEKNQVKEAFDKIWRHYPQLRVRIIERQSGLIQEVYECESDFRIIEETKSASSVLKDDLAEGFSKQLMRAFLFNDGTDNFLLWSHHHVLVDGWSVGILINQFIDLLDGKELPENNQNAQYKLGLAEKNIKQNNNQPKLNLEAQKFNLNSNKGPEIYEEQIQCFDDNQINVFCLKNGITEQQLFLTAISILNFSLTGQTEAYIHSISNGRSLIPEIAETGVGLFIKNIVLSWSWKKEDSIQDIVNSIQKGYQLAIQNENQLLEEILEYPEIPDILFVYENYPYKEVKGDTIEGQLCFNFERTGYPISLLIMPKEKGFQLKAIYNSGIFKTAFINHFLKSIPDLISEIINHFNQDFKDLFGKRLISEISVENPSHWIQIIDNNIQSFPNQFTTESNANKTLLFSDSNNIVKQLIATLEQFPTGSRIALFGSRTSYTPTLIYGIMRCGYSYVPINPAWPLNRINQVLKIANCKAIIYQDDIKDLNNIDVPSVPLKKILTNIKKEMVEIPPFDQEAYILFTSGSTGEPKGVSISHLNISAFLDACLENVDSSDYKQLFSLTNLGFDLSIFENLFGFYSNKTTVVVPSVEDLEGALLAYPEGLLNTVPSIISSLTKSEIKSLAVVHSAGEPFTEKLWGKLKLENPKLKIKNWYGPTETTTYSTMIDLSNEYNESVGTALKHEQILIVDYLKRPLPDEIEGELIILGKGVATKYLNAAGGFEENKGYRYYNTGDIGYCLKENIFLKGRIDNQVKRLGQRFELAEIERFISKQLLQIQNVKYVLINGMFILFLESDSTNKEETIAVLKKQFPAYMLPDELIFLEVFPHNNNGKIDSKKLVEFYLDQKETNALDHRGNDHYLLDQLRGISFFESLNGNYGFIQQGGDSILGLRLIGKLKNWGYQTEINDLMNANTINYFLANLEKSERIINSTDRESLTPIQQWFYSDYQGNRNKFNQSILLELNIPLESEHIQSVVDQTLKAFPILSMVYNGEWINGKEPQIKCIKINNEHEITAYCETVQSGFDLKQGPVAASVVFVKENQKWLFVVMHHFYCDGFSWRIFLDELKSRLNGEYNSYESYQVFSEVKHALSQYKGGYSEPSKIINPFEKLQAVTYSDSIYHEWEWTFEQTDLFMKKWEVDLNTNERFVYLILSVWLEANLPPVTPFLETHGRSHKGISRLFESIGWFTQFYPVFKDFFPEKNKLKEALKTVFAELPQEGLAYMAEENWKKPPYPLLLNFLGNFDENWGGMASPSKIPSGEMVDLNNLTLGIVEINAMIIEGKMKWMLRTHPNFKHLEFRKAFDSFSQNQLRIEAYSKHEVDESIDQDDLNAIDNLLNGL